MKMSSGVSLVGRDRKLESLRGHNHVGGQISETEGSLLPG